MLYFGSRETLTDGARYRELREMFPDACLIGCSTDGQICSDEIIESGVNAIGVRFDATTIRTAIETVENATYSRLYGEAIGRALASDDLAGVFVLSDGLAVNGSELVAGIATHVGNVPISGGLAGDGLSIRRNRRRTELHARQQEDRGDRTVWKLHQDRPWQRRRLGRVRPETADYLGQGQRAFIELDGKPALDLYERYLGEDADRGVARLARCFSRSRSIYRQTVPIISSCARFWRSIAKSGR